MKVVVNFSDLVVKYTSENILFTHKMSISNINDISYICLEGNIHHHLLPQETAFL